MKIIKFVTPFLLVIILLTSIFVKSDILAEQNNQKVTLETISGDENILNDIKIQATITDAHPLLQQWTLNADFKGNNLSLSQHKRTSSLSNNSNTISNYFNVDIDTDKIYDELKKQNINTQSNVNLSDYFEYLPIKISFPKYSLKWYDFDYIKIKTPSYAKIVKDKYDNWVITPTISLSGATMNCVEVGDYFYFTLNYDAFSFQTIENSHSNIRNFDYSGKSGLFRYDTKNEKLDLILPYDVSRTIINSSTEKSTGFLFNIAYYEKYNVIALISHKNSKYYMSIYDIEKNTLTEDFELTDTLPQQSNLGNYRFIDNKFVYYGYSFGEDYDNNSYYGVCEITKKDNKFNVERLFFNITDFEMFYQDGVKLGYNNDTLYVLSLVGISERTEISNYIDSIRKKINIKAFNKDGLQYNGEIKLDDSSDILTGLCVDDKNMSAVKNFYYYKQYATQYCRAFNDIEIVD